MKRFFCAVALLMLFSNTSWGQVFKIPEELLEHGLPPGMEKPFELSQLSLEEKKKIVFGIAPRMLEVYNNIHEVDPASADKMVEDRVEDTFRFMEEGFRLNDKIEAVEAGNKEIESIILKQNELLGEGKKNTERMVSFSDFLLKARGLEICWLTVCATLLLIHSLRELKTFLMVKFPTWGVSRSMKAARRSWLVLKPKREDSVPEIEERVGLAYGHIWYAYHYLEEARKFSNSGGYLGSVSNATKTLLLALKEFGMRRIDPERSRFSFIAQAIDTAHAHLDKKREWVESQEGKLSQTIELEVQKRTTTLQEQETKLREEEALLVTQKAEMETREAALKADGEKIAADRAAAQQLVVEADQDMAEANRILKEGQRLSTEGRNLLASCADLKHPAEAIT